jgi:hypothetical protein
MIPHRFGQGGVARPTLEEATLWSVLFLLAALMVSLAFAGRAEAYAAQPRVITNDDGGMIRAEYLPRINASIRAGQRVVIDGVCASACTYELRNPNACVTPRAQLYFHASPALPHIARMPDDHWMMTLYPARIQAVIRANGGLTHQGFWLSGPSLAGLVPACG